MTTMTITTNDGFKVTVVVTDWERENEKKIKAKKEFEELIMASLAVDEFRDVCSMPLWEEYSHQRITACIKPLVLTGKVERRKIMGKVVYRLVE